MVSSKVEFLFLKMSIEQFIKTLQKVDGLIKDKTLLEEEALEIMGYLVAAKENIEALEASYSKL